MLLYTLLLILDPGQPVERLPEGDTSFASMAADFKVHTSRRRAANRPDSFVEMDREIKRKFPRQQLGSTTELREPLTVQQESFFDSPEANKLFIGNSKSSENVESVLEDRIEMLSESMNILLDIEMLLIA
mmetsp:Transcript_16314/g.29464  ORF Transcript_16314/g.29464 Transcript_16314/m.29464 type:complete len:130 (+) Transcript_16314:164-553(+)